MTREQLIEAMAKAACQNMLDRHGACYDTCEITGKCCGEDIDLPGTAAALTALETAIPGLADVISGKAVVVPVEPEDGRPQGWTEARALEFIARGGTDEQDFAELFIEGGWQEIDRHYPQFRAMIEASRAMAEKAGE